MIGRVAIVGFGRFGRALADLVLDAGGTVRGWDPEIEVPERMRASSSADAVAGADVVIPAVPVTALTAVLVDLRSELGPDTLVIDVASVKRGPIDALRATLGDAVPWVATHPLFGPSSIALGERPLSVVVCPEPDHPDAAVAGRRFWERLGCEVVEQDAVAHDRVMARTHALAFFVAKGMIDLGVADRLPFAPPSFRAMSRTIESVRSDAGHLFRTIQTENPFAADTRAELLAALTAVDRDLRSDRPSHDPDGGGTPDIPGLGDRAPDLRATRDLIDDLDRDLVRLLVRRGHLSRRAGRAKHHAGRPIRDPAREAELLEARRRWARSAGLEPDAVLDVFERILRFSRDVQIGDD